MVGIKFSLVISVSIFLGYCLISSLTLGGLLSAFILVYDQSWRQQRIRGSHPLFLPFLISYFLSPFFQDFTVTLKEILALSSPDVKWCDINRNPYPSLAPPYQRRLLAKIHPSRTWPNCVLDTQIFSKRAVYIIKLISGNISFFQLVTLVLKLICYR